MSYIKEVSEQDAQGKLAEVYQGDLKSTGYIPNYHKVMSLRPEAIEGWRALQGAIRSKMRLRAFELVTLAAAQAMGCRY